MLTDAVSAENYLDRARSPSGGYALSLSTQQLVAVALIVALTADEHARAEDGHAIQNTFTFTKTAALLGPDRGRA